MAQQLWTYTLTTHGPRYTTRAYDRELSVFKNGDLYWYEITNPKKPHRKVKSIEHGYKGNTNPYTVQKDALATAARIMSGETLEAVRP